MLKNILTQYIFEENILKTSATKPIVDAIKNRRKISFNYFGPQKPKKESVKPGKRIKVEPVALGLSKKGKLIFRAWVEPPSVTKTGFQKGNWRTFILSRTRNLEITDEIFDTKRPGYVDGNDKSMTVTYVTPNWDKLPKIKKYEKPAIKPKSQPIKKVEPIKNIEPDKKKVEPIKQELPQPKPEVKPQSKPEIKPEVKPEIKQKEPEQNVLQKPLLEPKPEIKPNKLPNNKEENKDLKENLKRIKSLMFS